MRRHPHVLFALFVLSLTACGPSATQPGAGSGDGGDTGGGGGPDGGGPAVDLTGTVWAPGNAPGQVPAGQEIPVAGAVVYVAQAEPAPPPDHVTCTPCTDTPSGAVVSDAKGHFTLRAPAGSYWLVIQKAQFRIDQQITLSSATTLDASKTTLPSVRDPAHGTWIPRIALVLGYPGDRMEAVLGKLGIGAVDGNGDFVPDSAVGTIDVYDDDAGGIFSPGRSLGIGEPDVSTLVTDLDTMKQYDIIFFPCDVSGDHNAELLGQRQVRQNLYDYVAAGGRLYVADYAGEWVDNIFPGEVQLGPGQDTPASAYDRTTGTWDSSRFGDADGQPEYASHAQAADPGLAQWLDGQVGPDGPISAASFTALGNWNRIESLNDVPIGNDTSGQPVVDSPTAYVTGTTPGWGDGSARPLMATYEPAGCGRVMYSTFHTTPDSHVGLLPQERVMVYLLLEIGVCKEGPVVD